MKPAKIRLLEPQFLGYTGILCGIKFVDGISVAELPFVDQQRICASMRATTVEGKNVSPSAAYSSRNNLTAEDIVETPAPDIVPMKRGAAETKPKLVQRFTREELESIADCEGIAGLRQIGNQIGVKAKGIVEMIEGTLSEEDNSVTITSAQGVNLIDVAKELVLTPQDTTDYVLTIPKAATAGRGDH